MSNVFGNRGGGGGFANPATTNLDMNSIYKIVELANGTDPKDAINLSQLTSYNPFNQSLNINDSVQFQNVNMNGNWNIPNTQPASTNDTNLYIISAQGGLVTIPAGPSFTIRAQMGSSPQYNVVIAIPPMAYTYLDLCQFIQTSYNTNPLGSNLIGTMTICKYELGYLNIRITKDLIHFSGTFTIVYDGLNTPSAALGYNATFTTPCDTTAIAQLLVVFSTTVGWKVLGSSTTPITNGSPYIYSASEDKWYTSEALYTPNFLSYMDFNNASYNLFQNGSNRLKINSTDTYIYSPNSINFVNVSNDGVSVVQNGVARVSSTAFSTYMMAPNGITDCSVSNNGVGIMVATVARFSALSAGATTIKSADDQTTMTMTNTDITMTQGGFTKFAMNEDPNIGTSLWGPSGSGRLELVNSRINLRQNSINRFVINNSENYSFSPSLLNYSYKSNTEVANFFNSVNRFSIGPTSTILRSPSTNTNLTLTDTTTNLYVNSFLRFATDATETRILSPNSNVETTINDTTYYTNMTGYERILIDGTTSFIYSPTQLYNINVQDNGLILKNSSNTTKISLSDTDIITTLYNYVRDTKNGTGTFSYSPTQAMQTQLTDSFFKAQNAAGTNVLLIQPSTLSYNLGVARFVIDGARSRLSSQDATNYINIDDTEMANFFNSVNRFSIGSTSSILRSPDTNNYIDINNNGLIYSDAGSNRLSVSDTGCFIAAPNMSSYLSVSNNGGSITVDALARFTALSGGNTTIKSSDNTTVVTLAGDNFTASTSTNSLVVNTDFNYTKGAQLRIHADNSHCQLLSPNGLQAIEVNNTGVQVNLSSNSYTLPTTRGTAGQVISITGSNCSWTTPGANNAGFSLFNPLLSTATVGAGSKSYWYIVMVPCNTVLTGFKTVLSSGSDPFHVGIYRGKTTNSATTVLDLLAPIITPAGGGFYSAEFVLQAGRSAVYTAGEYITVMYHSQGSTNVFGNNVGIADTDLSYTTIANYGNATPPANLGGVAVSATNVNRLAIEFY